MERQTITADRKTKIARNNDAKSNDPIIEEAEEKCARNAIARSQRADALKLIRVGVLLLRQGSQRPFPQLDRGVRSRAGTLRVDPSTATALRSRKSNGR